MTSDHATLLHRYAILWNLYKSAMEDALPVVTDQEIENRINRELERDRAMEQKRRTESAGKLVRCWRVGATVRHDDKGICPECGNSHDLIGDPNE